MPVPHALHPMRLRRTLLALVATLPAACGDLPTDVADTTGLHTTETGLSAQVAPYSRSAVFRAAIDAVIETEGSQLLWRRTASLRAHSAAARAAQERGDTTAQLAAEQLHRDAQVAFMAHALGDARIDDIVHQVRGAADDARMRLDVLRTGGHDVTRAAVLVQDADALLARSGSQPADVLATALDAADILARLDQILRSVERLPSLDELFAATISEVRESAGPRAARALLAEHQTLVREAQGALADGGRVRAHDRLQQVRERQVRIVAQRMGEGGVRRHVGSRKGPAGVCRRAAPCRRPGLPGPGDQRARPRRGCAGTRPGSGRSRNRQRTGCRIEPVSRCTGGGSLTGGRGVGCGREPCGERASAVPPVC